MGKIRSSTNRDNYVHTHFVGKVASGSMFTLKKIGDAVYARNGNLETVAEALNQLRGCLNGQYDSLLECMAALAEQPVRRQTRSERVFGPGEVAVRLAKDYAGRGETAHKIYGELLSQPPVSAEALVKKIVGVGNTPSKTRPAYYAVRDGIPRPRAYGTPHCAVRMKLRP